MFYLKNVHEIHN
uniref:Uncharacterized protein n=1 Tax=Anguilla anguilla TaxID=7936 RepID=A0A0E9UK27_ANGAN